MQRRQLEPDKAAGVVDDEMETFEAELVDGLGRE
jgi:hypothetical protein